MILPGKKKKHFAVNSLKYILTGQRIKYYLKTQKETLKYLLFYFVDTYLECFSEFSLGIKQ